MEAKSSNKWDGPEFIAQARTLFVLVLLTLALWALIFSRFVPTLLGQEIAGGAALVVAGAAAAFGAWGKVFHPDHPGYEKLIARAPALEKRSNRIMSLALLGFLAAFLAFQGGVLELWTAVVGHPGRMLVHGDYHDSSRSQCAGLSIREAPFLLRRVICTPRLTGSQVPPGMPVLLFGRQSAVGIEVHGFRVYTGAR